MVSGGHRERQPNKAGAVFGLGQLVLAPGPVGRIVRSFQTLLLITLGTEAAMAGFRGRSTLATRLVNELVEATDRKILIKTIAHHGRVDLPCRDDSATWSRTVRALSCCSKC